MSRWKFVLSVLEDKLKALSGLAAAILKLRCRSMSAIVGGKFVETGNTENLGVAVGILFLSVLEGMLQVFPVLAAAISLFAQYTLMTHQLMLVHTKKVKTPKQCRLKVLKL